MADFAQKVNLPIHPGASGDLFERGGIAVFAPYYHKVVGFGGLAGGEGAYQGGVILVGPSFADAQEVGMPDPRRFLPLFHSFRPRRLEGRVSSLVNDIEAGEGNIEQPGQVRGSVAGHCYDRVRSFH